MTPKIKERPEEDYCPICGIYCGNYHTHRCSSKILSTIDSANTRAENLEEEAFANLTDPKFHDKLVYASELVRDNDP